MHQPATIGYALTQAGNGDEVRVAEGTYTETLDIGITVTLKGGYEATGWTRDIAAHPAIVDGSGANASVFRIHPGAVVTVEGFTVQGGTEPGEGGGFFINGAAVVISGTVVQDNTAVCDQAICKKRLTLTPTCCILSLRSVL